MSPLINTPPVVRKAKYVNDWVVRLVTMVGMQRVGKFPGIFETFHGNFQGVGIFNFDLFSTFEIVRTKVNRTEFSLHYIRTHLYCTTFLTVYWFAWVHRKNHKAL